MKAAIKVGPLMFTGESHAEAFKAALDSAKIPQKVKIEMTRAFSDGKANLGFDDNGVFLTREEADEKYGFSTSQEMADWKARMGVK